MVTQENGVGSWIGLHQKYNQPNKMSMCTSHVALRDNKNNRKVFACHLTPLTVFDNRSLSMPLRMRRILAQDCSRANLSAQTQPIFRHMRKHSQTEFVGLLDWSARSPAVAGHAINRGPPCVCQITANSIGVAQEERGLNPDGDGDAQVSGKPRNHTVLLIISKRRPQAELPKHVEHAPNVDRGILEAYRTAIGQWNFKIKEP